MNSWLLAVTCRVNARDGRPAGCRWACQTPGNKRLSSAVGL